jgi:hypothetical protein
MEEVKPAPASEVKLPIIQLNDKQKEDVNKLREIVKDCEDIQHKYHLRDFYLARWLVARNWNIEQAAKMFKDSMKWRKENNIDYIFKNFEKEHAAYLEHYNKFWPGSVDYNTLDGWPLFMEMSGSIDPYSLIVHTPPNVRFALNIWKMEKVEKIRRKKEKECGYTAGITMIVDMRGLGWHHMNPAIMEILKADGLINKLNYPETLRKNYIINAPGIFTMVWNIVSPWLDPSTQDKTAIFGGNYLDALLQAVSIDCIPENFGGKAPALPPGGVFRPLMSSAQLDKQEIPAGRAFEKEIEVEAEHATLEWEFTTLSHDIGFSVSRVDEAKYRNIVVPFSRVQSNTGVLDVVKGKYVLIWDNKFSWRTKKIIEYSVTVLENKNTKHQLTDADTEKLQKLSDVMKEQSLKDAGDNNEEPPISARDNNEEPPKSARDNNEESQKDSRQNNEEPKKDPPQNNEESQKDSRQNNEEPKKDPPQNNEEPQKESEV